MMVIIPKHTAVTRTMFGHLMYPRMDVKVMFNLYKNLANSFK
jgi:hypothetical protein